MRTPLAAIIVAGVCLLAWAFMPIGYWPLTWVLPILCLQLRLTDDGREHSLMRRELKQLTDARIR